MDMFYASLGVLIAICAVLHFYSGTRLPSSKNGNFIRFQRTYLVVFLMAMGADWLQGPHVYALYDSYGMSTQQIEELFVAGFGSSMIFGTFVGSLADTIGRRFNVILYGITYLLACVTKHVPNYYVLMVGRFLAGLSTSILYSAFESWVVFEHHARGFDEDLLSNLFAHATLGNSVVAIIAGVVAQLAADWFGYVAPFDCSIVVLLLMIAATVMTWNENHGSASSNARRNAKMALRSILFDRKVFCLGAIQGLFEGAMYTFVLEWTPALSIQPEPNQPASLDENHIPHGIVFTGFMLSVMIGSAVFKILSHWSTVESFMRPLLFVAAVSLAVPMAFPANQLLIYIAFLIFEVCVGVFWPAMCTMRGKYVPEETRSTVMNFFRIPLNFIVIAILLSDFSMKNIFNICSIFLFASFVFQQVLYTATKRNIVSISESTYEIKIDVSSSEQAETGTESECEFSKEKP